MSNVGRRIREVWFPGPEEASRPQDGESFIFRNEFHGDHDEDWISVEVDGREVRRYNARYVETIVWADE